MIIYFNSFDSKNNFGVLTLTEEEFDAFSVDFFESCFSHIDCRYSTESFNMCFGSCPTYVRSSKPYYCSSCDTVYVDVYMGFKNCNITKMIELIDKQNKNNGIMHAKNQITVDQEQRVLVEVEKMIQEGISDFTILVEIDGGKCEAYAEMIHNYLLDFDGIDVDVLLTNDELELIEQSEELDHCIMISSEHNIPVIYSKHNKTYCTNLVMC